MRSFLTRIYLLSFLLIALSLFGDKPPELPNYIHSLIYYPFKIVGCEGDVAQAIKNLLIEHGYSEPKVLGGEEPGDSTNPKLEDFLTELNSGKYGHVLISSHGSPGWLGVEFFPKGKKGARDKRVKELDSIYFGGNKRRQEIQPGVHTEIDSIKIDTITKDTTYYLDTTLFSINISPTFLQNQVDSLPHSLVFLLACHSGDGSSSIMNAFSNLKAHCVFGWNGEVISTQQEPFAPIDIFYRMGAKNYGPSPNINQSILKNKSAANALSECQYSHGKLTMTGNSDMRIYNSPRIAGVLITQDTSIVYQYGFYADNSQKYPYEWAYPGSPELGMKTPANIGDDEIKVKILFSSFMDEEMLDEVRVHSEEGNEKYIVSGDWAEKTIFDRDVWEGSFKIDSWVDSNSKAVLIVDAKDNFEGDINEALDTTGNGKSNGKDIWHKFKVTDAAIVKQKCAKTKDGGGSLQNFALSNYSNLALSDFSEGSVCFLEPRADEMPVDISKFYFTFSKPMDKDITDAAVETDPPFEYDVSWEDEEQINLELSDELDYCKDYTITLLDTLKDTSGVKLDGNEDGTAGGNYIFKFSTEPPDVGLYLSPFVANVEEGHPIHPKLYTNGGELKKEVDCNIDFNIANSGGWTVTEPNELSFSLPPEEVHDDKFTIKNNGTSFPLMITPKIPFKCTEIFSMGFYWSAQGHQHDHPDENQSPGDMEYPTPWITRTQPSPAKTQKLRADSVLPEGLPDVGILLSGWADGYGHILGKYGMETLPIKPDLKILNNEDVNISDSVKLLVIGSAGLKGFNSPKTFTTEFTEKKQTHREHRGFFVGFHTQTIHKCPG